MRVTRSPTWSNSPAETEMDIPKDERLPFPHLGTDPRLTDVPGEVIQTILA